ncbi:MULTISPECIES: hypothetical protein [Kamptonema]|nr:MULTISPECIES: hypothetical protein [Kamptonema]
MYYQSKSECEAIANIFAKGSDKEVVLVFHQTDIEFDIEYD